MVWACMTDKETRTAYSILENVNYRLQNEEIRSRMSTANIDNDKN
jgi:hypothetical protein